MMTAVFGSKTVFAIVKKIDESGNYKECEPVNLAGNHPYARHSCHEPPKES